MTGEAILTVSAAVVLLVQLAKWAGLPRRLAPLFVLLMSLLGVAFWGWAMGTIGDRMLAFEYFAGWISVAAAAAGVFGFAREAPGVVTAMKKRPPAPVNDPT